MDGLRVVLVFGVLLVLKETEAQRTYMRHCDCEYTVDGKCAYTLLLPTTSESTCTSTDSGELTTEIDSIKSNLTSLTTQMLDNVNLLSQLQGYVLRLLMSNSTNTDMTDVEIELSTLTDNITEYMAAVQKRLDYIDEDVDLLKQLIARLTSRFDDMNMTKIAEDALETRISKLEAELQSITRECVNKKAMLAAYSRGDFSSINVTVEVSSQFNSDHGVDKVRVDLTATPGAWCPVEPNGEEYLEYNLGSTSRLYGVVTKGRSDYQQWVTSYSVQYKMDNASSWMNFANVLGETEIFEGNSDQNTAKVNMFWQPISAQYLRIYPLSAYLDRNKCMRADIIGCLDDLKR